MFGSVPLNKEGSDLTAYPDTFLYSTFNDGSVGLNNTELSTDHRQTISRRGLNFTPDDGIKTITLQITNTTTLIGAVTCLLYTSPSPRDNRTSRMPSSA